MIARSFVVIWILAATTGFVVVVADEYPVVVAGHLNTKFCGRISIGDTNKLFAGLNDPLNCFPSPDAHVKNVTRGGSDRTDFNLSPCFDFTLDRTVNGWSDQDAALCGYVTSPVDDGKERAVWCYYDLLRKLFCAAFGETNERPETPLECRDEWKQYGYGYIFDAPNTTRNETIYLKGSSCDSREWENQDIMFEDMTDLNLEIYNEKFVEHLTCPLLQNYNVRVDDDRRTRVESKICQPDRMDCYYRDGSYPEEYHENLLIGARFEALFGVDSNGNDFIPMHAQRQQNDQVCISYRPNLFDPHSKCASFCMNVGEETNVPMGSTVMKIRISDANIEKEDAVQFTKVEVQVIIRDKNGNAMISNDDDISDDDDWFFFSVTMNRTPSFVMMMIVKCMCTVTQ